MVIMTIGEFLEVQKYWQVVDFGFTEPMKGAVQTDAQKADLDALKLKRS